MVKDKAVFLAKVRKKRDSTLVTIQYGDLVELVRATQKVVKFQAMSEMFEGEHLFIETEILYESFARAKDKRKKTSKKITT